MAIAKMQHILLATTEDNRERLLERAQELQEIEFYNIDKSDLKDEFLLSNDNKAYSSITQNLLETQNQLNQVRQAQEILKDYVAKKSFKEKFRAAPVEYDLAELAKEVEENQTDQIIKQLFTSHERKEEIDEKLKVLAEDEAFFRKWEKLAITPEKASQLRYVDVFIGTVPQRADNESINYLRTAPGLVIEELFQNDEEHGLIAYTSAPAHEDLQVILRDAQFQALQYNHNQLPTDEFQRVQTEIAELKEERQEVVKSLKNHRDDLYKLELAEEYYYAQEQRQIASEMSLSTKNLFAVSGWLEKERHDDFVAEIRQALPNKALAVSYQDIDIKNEEEVSQVPIKLNNNAIVEPFETITTMYSLPKYTEFDPTWAIVPFYMLFFGMMMGDLGYGILMWLVTFLVLKFMHLKPGARNFMKFGHLLSYPTMITGIIYGSLFGASIPTGIVNPIDDAVTIMIVSMLIGYVHLIFALCLNIYVNWKNGDKLSALKDGLSWIGILVGLGLLVLGLVVTGNPMLVRFGGGIAIVAALAIVILSMIGSTNKGVGLALGLYDLYGMTSYVGDLISYVRLMALGMSGGSIAMAFNMLIGYLPPVARFSIGILLIVALQLFNMGLSLLSAYVHGARLIFVEFFGKFYEGGGKAFQPLKGLEEYIVLRKNKNI